MEIVKTLAEDTAIISVNVYIKILKYKRSKDMKLKSIKKAAGLFMAMALTIAAIPTTLFAAPTWDGTKTEGSLQIIKTDDSSDDQTRQTIAGAEYTLYKVATITGSSSTQNGMTYVPTTPTNKPITSGITADDFTDADLVGLTGIKGENTDDQGSLTAADGVLNFSNLELGVYLVKETVTPAGVIASNDFIVSIPMTIKDDSGVQSWVYDVTATPKNTVFSGTIGKTVEAAPGSVIRPDANNPDANGDPNKTVNIGTELKYTIAATLPTNFYGTDGKTYTQYDIVDEASTGLTVDTTSIVVTNTTTNEVLVLNDDYKVTVAGQKFTVSLVDSVSKTAISDKYSAGDEITITYSAVVNEEAVPGVVLENNVWVDYDYEGSDGPGKQDPDPDPEKPDLYTYSHALVKVNDGTAALDGAKFNLKDPDGKFIKLNATNDGWTTTTVEADAYVFVSGAVSPLVPNGAAHPGFIEFYGLAVGDYTLTEIEAPDGYSLLDQPVKVTLSKESTVTQQNSGYDVAEADDYTTKVINVAGWTLPGTGGAGIYVFIIGGIALIGAAMILLAKTSKKSNKA